MLIAAPLVVRAQLRKRAEARLKEDIRAGRISRAVEYLVRRGRVQEAAALEEGRGEVDRAAGLLEKAGEIEAAAAVFDRAGEWQMAALTLKRAERLSEAADVYARHGRLGVAAELLEEAGDVERASALYEKIGALDRVAALAARQGDDERAAKLQAEHTEQSGDHGQAAELWEAIGNYERAIRAWKRAGRLDKAGHLEAQHGDLAKAAAWLVEGGDYLAAAGIFARLGKYAEAAEAAYRGGDAPGCIGYLTVTGDHLEMARVFTQYGLTEQAKQALRDAPRGSKQYVPCMEALAAREAQDGNDLAAVQAYKELITLAEERRQNDGEVKRWLLRKSELLFAGGYAQEAMQALEKIDRLGLADDELRTRFKALRPTMEETMTLAPGAAPPAAMKAKVETLTAPTHPRYEIRRKLGQGGNGIVYHAWDRKLGRELVVKMIANEALPSEMARRWFRREALTSARLNHPNIVTVYDIGEIEQQPFIAMEYVEGDTLREKVEDKLPLSIDAVKPIWSQLASAVEYAHGHGVVHRDIKLDNVMLTSGGVVKLMDFGLAIALNGPDQSVVMAGTPLYMSPEQIRGMDVDQQTDVYALGVLLFKLLTGHYPFEDGNILEHHRATPPPDPRRLNERIPRKIARAITQALAKQKSDRFGSVEALARAILA